MTHSPQRSGTFILAPALRTAPGRERVGPREPARGSPQLPRAGEGRVRTCAGALESAAMRTEGGGGRGRANLEPTNDGTARALDRGATREGRAQGLKGGVRTLQLGREDGSRARTKWPRRLLHPLPHPGSHSAPFSSYPGIADDPLQPPRFHIPTLRSCRALGLGMAPSGRAEGSDPSAVLG